MTPLEPMKYSERLGVIEPDQLHEAAAYFDIGEVLDASAPVGGLFGQNIFLTTTEGEYVLRGHPHGHVQLTKERCVARFIHERSSLPVPWPYEICENTEVFGWTYAVMPRIPGTSGGVAWAGASEDERIEVAAASGEALAMLQEATSETFGPYDAQLDAFVAMDDFAEWWLHRFEYWRGLCRAINALSTEAERYIDEILERHAPALSEPFTPVLVHHDFKPGNLNFERDGETFVATGVFDLMEAYLADGEEDISRMLWSVQTDDERGAFMDAYVADVPLRDGCEDRAILYALADWIVIWEYGKRNGVWFGDQTFMDSFRPILRNVRAVTS